MFKNTKQQDYIEAFNIICDVLDKAAYVQFHFNNLYSSNVKDNFCWCYRHYNICISCKMVALDDTEYSFYIYIPFAI